MERRLCLLIAAALLTGISCGKKVTAAAQAPAQSTQTPAMAMARAKNEPPIEPCTITLALDSPVDSTWVAGESIILRNEDTREEVVLTLKGGSGVEEIVSEVPAFTEGSTFSVYRGPESITFGAGAATAFRGEGSVEGNSLEIRLSPVSAFVLLPSNLPCTVKPMSGSIATAAKADTDSGALEPTATADSLVIPSGNTLLSLAPDSGEVAILVRDGAAFRTCVVNVPSAGETVAAPQLTAFSAGVAERLGTEYSLTNLKRVVAGHTPGEFSGITKISDGRYALVHNGAKGGGIYFMDLELSGGKVRSALIEPAPGTEAATNSRDPEGIAYVPSTRTIWTSGETAQDILEYDLSGKPTGRALEVPSDLLKPALSTQNGFESLTYDEAHGELWTVTEEPLKSDVAWSPLGLGERILRLQGFDIRTRKPSSRRFYAMDLPIYSHSSGDTYIHGVSDITALSDGTFLVMEREVFVPAYNSSDYGSIVNMLAVARTATKFYRVNPHSDEALLSKTLVAAFATHFPGVLNLMLGDDPQLANFEGICEGPLIDGRPSLILVNDSEKAKGNKYAQLQDYIKIIVL